MFFPHKTNNGILKYLYTRNAADYWNQLNISVTNGYNDQKLPKNAFDWDLSTYWITKSNSPINNRITFCFNKYFVKINGFEITTSPYDARPSSFSFGASYRSDIISQSIQVNHAFKTKETYYHSFPPGTFRCFSYINSGRSTRGDYGADIAQIEIFGILLENESKNIRNWKISLLITKFIMSFIVSK